MSDNKEAAGSTERRRFLEAIGALGVVGLAGCGGDGDEDTPTDTEAGGNGNGNGDTPTETEGGDGVFEITDLTIEPEDAVSSGETITVSTEITNTADVTGTQTVEYRIDGDTVADQELELEGFGSGTATFEDVDTSDLEPGQSYEHGVYTEDDERTATLEIQEPPELNDPMVSFDGGLLSTGEVEITGEWTNPYLFTVADGEITLEVPDGWEVVEESGTTFDELDSLGSQGISWTVNVPEDASGDYSLTATSSYSDGVQDPVEFTVEETVTVFSEQEGQAVWTAADYDVDENPEDSWEPMANVDTWSIQEDDDGKHLAFAGPASERTNLRFTDVDSTLTVDVRVKLKATDAANDYWIYVRGMNEDDPDTLSMGRADDFLQPDDESLFRLSHYVEGEYGSIVTTDRIGEVDDAYHVRARYEGETWSAKWWLDGEDEPDDWQLEADPGINDPGFVGAGHWEGSPPKIYEYSVGTGGNEAP